MALFCFFSIRRIPALAIGYKARHLRQAFKADMEQEAQIMKMVADAIAMPGGESQIWQRRER